MTQNLIDIKNTNAKAYIISDLHGNLEDLVRFMKKVKLIDKLRNGNTYFIVTGDAMDRGDESRDVMDILTMLKNDFSDNVFNLMGNHDFENYRIFKGFYEQMYKFSPFSPYLEKKDKMQFSQFSFVMSGEMKESDSIFIKNSPFQIKLPNELTITHAGPNKVDNPVKDLENTIPEGFQDLIWGRHKSLTNDKRIAYTKKDLDKFLAACKSEILISGHTPASFGYHILDNNNLILSTSYGAFDTCKAYLEIDLKKSYSSARELVKNCLKYIYGGESACTPSRLTLNNGVVYDSLHTKKKKDRIKLDSIILRWRGTDVLRGSGDSIEIRKNTVKNITYIDSKDYNQFVHKFKLRGWEAECFTSGEVSDILDLNANVVRNYNPVRKYGHRRLYSVIDIFNTEKELMHK